MLKVDVTGRRIGRLIVLSQGPETEVWHGKKTVVLHCQCDCGRKRDVFAARLFKSDGTLRKRPYPQSCGCLQKEMTAKSNKEHSKKSAKKRFGQSGSDARKEYAEFLKGKREESKTTSRGANISILSIKPPYNESLNHPYRGVRKTKSGSWQGYFSLQDKRYQKTGFDTAEKAKLWRDETLEQKIKEAGLERDYFEYIEGKNDRQN